MDSLLAIKVQDRLQVNAHLSARKIDFPDNCLTLGKPHTLSESSTVYHAQILPGTEWAYCDECGEPTVRPVPVGRQFRDLADFVDHEFTTYPERIYPINIEKRRRQVLLLNGGLFFAAILALCAIYWVEK